MQFRSRWSAGRRVAFLACVLGALSCDSALEPSVDNVAQIVLSPSSGSVQAGATLTLNALVLDGGGNVMRDRKVVWASENASVATVSQSGVVTGVAAGTALIAASSGGRSASATITVTARPVTLVRVTPGSATIAVTGSLTLKAEGIDASGAPVEGRPVAWTSSNETIALVSAGGVVAGISAGSATITATIDRVAGTAVITVAPQPVASVTVTPQNVTMVVGTRVTLRATPFDAGGVPLTGRTIEWTSSDANVATVSSSGEVVGLAVGTARIRALVEGRSAEATVLVQPVPVARVATAPNQVTLNPGQTSQMIVTLTDSAGNVLSGRSIAYSTSDAAVATVSSSGLITAVAEGQATITATSEGKSASTLVTVNPVPVASIRITPSSVSLRIGQTMRLLAEAFDAQGRPLANRKFTWISGAPAVATITQAGEVSAVSSGTAAVFAATEGVSAFANVTVSNIPVASVQIVPGSLSLQQGASQTLGVITRDAAGNVLNNRIVTWASSNDAVAVVSSSGRVTAVTPGTATITATSEGVSGIATVNVSNVPVASVSVTPGTPTLSPGQTLGMTATMRDAGGNILSGRAVTWASSATSVATVDAQGVVTAVAAGSATISATSEGVTGSTTVTVSAVPVARVDVIPTAVSLNPTQTSQLTATVYDAGNNVLSRPVTWTSNAQGVATVSATGVVTAVAPGSATISATSGGVSGTAIITVSLVPVASVIVTPNMFPGQTLTLSATARDAQGNVLTGRTTSWSSSNAAVATVDGATGLVTAVTTGAATITATVDGVSGSATVTINQVPVASVTLAPASASIFKNQQTGFIATARDANGNVLSRPITWSTTSGSLVISVTQGGIVTGVNPGTQGVIATAVGAGIGGTDVADTSQVTVSLVPVASMTMSPKPITMLVSQSGQMTVALFDSVNGPLTAEGRTISWVSRNPAIASVSASGLLTANAAGNTWVVVSTPGATATVFDSTTVTVNAPSIASVTVQPNPDAVYQGATRSLRAVLRDALNNVVRGQAVTWSSSNPAVATVAGVGGTPDSARYTGVSNGTATITATASNGVNGSTTVTVSLAPATSVVVTPSSQSLQLPDSITLAAQAKDSAGTNQTRTITWVSLNPSIATVSSSGKVNTLASGTATIQARANAAGAGGTDVVGTATITVTAVVHTVTFNASRSTTVPGDTITTTIALRDTLNNVLTGKPITYTSSNPAVATVDAQGVITGAGVGSTTITATSEGKSATVNVTGVPGIANIAIACTGTGCANASDATIPTGQSKMYTVTVTDGSGNVVAGAVFAVASSNSTIAVGSPTSITTDAQGQATLTIAAGGSAGTATITLTGQPRTGAIPPGSPGSNTPGASIGITVQ
jgi:trimeric autotransporter adhesin